MINSVVLVGRLGADPELAYTQSGTAVCKFRLAVDRPPRDGQEQEPNWFNIVAFERQAELAHQYLDRGALAGIEGRLQSRSWQREDGTRGYAVESWPGAWRSWRAAASARPGRPRSPVSGPSRSRRRRGSRRSTGDLMRAKTRGERSERTCRSQRRSSSTRSSSGGGGWGAPSQRTRPGR